MKKRTESFFGLHFDFHAKENTKNIGKHFKHEWLDELLETVKPDFVQCDSKGHPGITSYPSAYGTSAPDMCIDILDAFRKITKKHDVALFAHYSGVYDVDAMKHHPEWAVVDKNGETDPDHASVFGPYLDEKMLPQLREIAGKYGLNGAWIDGECWGCRLDFSDHAKKAFKEKFGRDVDYDKDKKEYIDFCREGFWNYIRRYIETINKEYPDFQITSNWAMSSSAPYPYPYEESPFKFLSGDLTWVDAIDSGARFEPRFMQVNRLPWDIMSWGFVLWSTDVEKYPMKIFKPAEQIMQEVSHTLALGGGVQVYFMQSPEYGIRDKDVIRVSKQVADFCRARKPYCHGKEAVKEVGLLFSQKKYYDELGETLFAFPVPYIYDFRLVNNVVLDNGYSTLFHVIEKKEPLEDYKTLILTNTDLLSKDETEYILKYAENGGNLVVTGEKSTAFIAKELGINFTLKDETSFTIENGERFVECKTGLCLIDEKDCEVVARGYYGASDYYEPNAENFVAIARKRYGNGKITFVPFAIGKTYDNRKPIVIRDFMRLAVGEEPLVQPIGTHLVDVAVSQDEGKKYIHLINNGGRHSSTVPTVYDEIVPFCNLTVKIKCDKKPAKITLQPLGKSLDFEYKDGAVFVTLDKLHIYEILQIE